MKHENYPTKADTSLLKFEFFSEGPKGKIKKRIIFRQTKNRSVFNLGFGDVDIETGEINDSVITDNKDSQKVLGTVASTIYKFFEKYADCYVFATGSTVSRTRLYQIGIANNLDKIKKDFELFGFIAGYWEEFEKGTNYEAFLIKKIGRFVKQWKK